MLRDILRKAGILPPAPPSDQAYYEASVDNALIEHDKIIGRVVGIAESGKESNEILRAGIARIRSSSSRDMMSELVHGMRRSAWHR
jgi:hypothetical protein